MKRIWVGIIVLSFLFSACSLSQIGTEPTVEPARGDLIKTVVAATFQALTPQNPAQVGTATPEAPTAIPLPSATPTAVTVNVSGKVCYQNKGMVELTLYFLPDGSDKPLTQTVKRPEETYSMALPPGKYQIYGWPPDYTIGVLAENKPTLDVSNAKPVTNLDFCDYSKGPFAVPYPPGVSPSKAAGSISGTISGYQGEGPLTLVATNQGSGYWYYFILLISQTDFEMPDLPAGRYQVVAYDESGITGGTEPNVYVVAGQKTTITISNWGGGFPPMPEIK